ncbi:MAG: ATP synthase F1 subunit epsilon [bacterium]|nr:ATP synthase F1 subunit epsilon [bacterium]
MEAFYVRVIACDHTFYAGLCKQVIIPLEDGSYAIQAHHENAAFAVEIGELYIQLESGEWALGVVGKGFAQVSHNRATIIVDTLETPEQVDRRRAMEAKERAEEQLRQKKSIQEYYHSNASLARAMSRLSITNKKTRH